MTLSELGRPSRWKPSRPSQKASPRSRRRQISITRKR
jgi:hypothetical protein